MKPRTTTILYWSLTTLFCLLMLADGLAGLLQVEGGREAFRLLGYPMYALLILGAAKLLGALALAQPWFRTLKEWAFAGFAINFIGAAASTAFAGMGLVGMLPAVVMLVVLFGLYYLWKQSFASPQLATITTGSPATCAASPMAVTTFANNSIATIKY